MQVSSTKGGYWSATSMAATSALAWHVFFSAGPPEFELTGLNA
jgi:hypothetical protein